MKIEGYDVVELAPGVKEYTKVGDGHISYQVGMPWVHIHYQTSDEDGKKTGCSDVELCCHGCDGSLWVTTDYPLPMDAAKPVMDDFKSRHSTCWEKRPKPVGVERALYDALGGEHPMTTLCPPGRSSMHHLDMRGKL